MKQQRQPVFREYSDVIQEIEILRNNGYSKGGRWTLGQVCRHLSFYYRGSLESFGFTLPWIVRATVGKWALKNDLSPGKRKPGGATVPQSVFRADPDDLPGVEEAISLLRRLDSHRGPLHPSPLYGDLSLAQWKMVHLNHSAHHLGFLLR